MSFSSGAVDRCGYRLGTTAKLIAVGLAKALCRRFHFVTAPGIVSRAFRILRSAVDPGVPMSDGQLSVDMFIVVSSGGAEHLAQRPASAPAGGLPAVQVRARQRVPRH